MILGTVALETLVERNGRRRAETRGNGENETAERWKTEKAEAGGSAAVS